MLSQTFGLKLITGIKLSGDISGYQLSIKTPKSILILPLALLADGRK